MVLVHVTPMRTEPYEINIFDKYQTMASPISSTGTNVSLGTLPPASPAERLRFYIRTKLAEHYLAILQIHTGPQQYHFGTITNQVYRPTQSGVPWPLHPGDFARPILEL